jgi:hypothetical protein
VEFIFMIPKIQILPDGEDIERLFSQVFDDLLLDVVVGIESPFSSRLQIPTFPYSLSEPTSPRSP